MIVATALLFVTSATEVTVHLYNEAGVPAKALEQAVKSASRVMRRAEVRVRWFDCYAAPEACKRSNALEVSVTAAMDLPVRMASFGMGHSLLPADGRGIYAKVMWNRVVRYAKDCGVPASVVLGNAIAHELGHLLMGSGQHSVDGIMAARWTRAQGETMVNGRLGFHGYESARLRRGAVELAAR